MTDEHGPWTIHGSTQSYRNEMITVVEDQVTKPDGTRGTYATVRMPAGVAVLPVERDGRVLLVSQYRYALGRMSLEVVSGALEEGEDAEAGARREMREELGVEADELVALGHMDLDTSIVSARVDLFIARGLRHGEKDEDPTEQLETIEIGYADALGRVMESEITHAPSCVLLLKARDHVAA